MIPEALVWWACASFFVAGVTTTLAVFAVIERFKKS